MCSMATRLQLKKSPEPEMGGSGGALDWILGRRGKDALPARAFGYVHCPLLWHTTPATIDFLGQPPIARLIGLFMIRPLAGGLRW